MDSLLIEKTASTPYINFNAESHVLVISGESFPENAAKFYAPVMEWLKAYISGLKEQEVLIEFEIVYFNSSTSKIFMMIFSMLDDAVSEGKSISVKWRCDERNETAIECGEEFKEDLAHLPFDIVFLKGV